MLLFFIFFFAFFLNNIIAGLFLYLLQNVISLLKQLFYFNALYFRYNLILKSHI